MAELAAGMLKLDLPPECRNGVRANLALLATHAGTLESWLDREGAAKR